MKEAFVTDEAEDITAISGMQRMEEKPVEAYTMVGSL